jgi:predicted GNAT family N-acyltransferase
MKQLTENLNASHNKKEFSCGNIMLDEYFHKQANQDVKRKLAACFVLRDEHSSLVKGYYTLSSNGIPQDFIPIEFQKKLPNSYSTLPTTLLGRLAVDNRFKGQGLGKILLIDALQKCYEISKSIGSFAVVVDPIDQEAILFYTKYGFITLPDSGKMFLPMNTIKTLFE